jgi:hypothetical protein
MTLEIRFTQYIHSLRWILVRCDCAREGTEKENVPLTRIAVGDKMISNGEGAHRWADPILPVMYLARLGQGLGQTSPQ